MLPYLKEAGAAERSSPAEAVEAARRLIAYYDIRQQEPQYAILETIKQSIPEETITVWDVTQFGYYSRTHYQVNQPGTYIDSGFSFNLGYAFPTALGAKVARPDTPVVCFIGDGGFMFNASELSTAVKYGINTVTVVFSDDSYGNVARDLDDFFGGSYETDLHNPDLVKFAESFGAVGLRAEDPLDLATLLPEALEPLGPGNHRRPGPEPGVAARQVFDPPAQGPVDAAAGRYYRVLSPTTGTFLFRKPDCLIGGGNRRA